MAKRSVNWAAAREFFENNGFRLDHQGGDIVVVGPKTGVRGKNKHRIGHIFTSAKSTQLSSGHLSSLCRKFGITTAHLTGQEEWDITMHPDYTPPAANDPGEGR